jgi:cytosine/adenosine deaminase-related metal-dependent hydrolase
MKADFVSFDAGAEHGLPTERAAPRLAVIARALLVAASLAVISGGVVLAALWFVWKLAEVVP